MDYEEIKKRILDRYSIDELIEVLGLDVLDVLENFEDRIFESIKKGDLDV